MIPFEYDVDFQADVFLSELAGEEKYIGVGDDGKVKAMPNPGGLPSGVALKVLDFETTLDAYIPIDNIGEENEIWGFPLLTNNGNLPGQIPNSNKVYSIFRDFVFNRDEPGIESYYFNKAGTQYNLMYPISTTGFDKPHLYLVFEQDSQYYKKAGIKGRIYYYEFDFPSEYDEVGNLTNPIWEFYSGGGE